MSALLHVPILRGGAPYRSLDTMRTPPVCRRRFGDMDLGLQGKRAAVAACQ